jgi:copper(I)-binding protein
MKRYLNGLFILPVLLLTAPMALAAEGGLVARDAWVPEAPPVAPVMAGYVVLENHGAKPVVLVNARSPQFDKVQFHRSVEKDGMAKMIRQKQVTVAPGKSFTFAPGGYHLMLMGPKSTFSAGQHVKVTFQTQHGETLPVDFEIKKRDMGGMGGMDGMHHHH